MAILKKRRLDTYTPIEVEGFAIISCSWRAVFEHGYGYGSEKILILPCGYAKFQMVLQLPQL